jgi:hypothetical protein
VKPAYAPGADQGTLTPWANLPAKAPFVLAADRPFVDAFNGTAGAATRVHTDLLPEPFVGRLDAPVVLLLLNPGVHADDAALHKESAFASRLRTAIASGTAEHLHLTPGAAGPGHRWWLRATRPLIEATSREAVAQGILGVQYFPYHSPTFAHAHLRLPSQSFTFGLVQQAMERGAEIVVGRGGELWLGAVPAVAAYPRLARLKSPRTVVLSPANVLPAEAFARWVRCSQSAGSPHLG